MSSMRLFTGIPVTTEVRTNLERLLNHLRPHAHLKWSQVYNLHITTKFIGEWPAERLEEVDRVLAKLPPRPEIPIQIQSLGWFPNPHSPRILWAGVAASPPLAELARQIEEILLPLGIAQEDKPFRPHLTLARVPPATTLTQLRETIAALESVEFGQYHADHFDLFESEPGPSGTIYKRLQRYPLAA